MIPHNRPEFFGTHFGPSLTDQISSSISCLNDFRSSGLSHESFRSRHRSFAGTQFNQQRYWQRAEDKAAAHEAAAAEAEDHKVFLSFRGEDTRESFVQPLRRRLDSEGFKAYLDEGMERGEEIKSELMKAIQLAKVSVVVISRNFAESSWCLEELVEIMSRWRKRKQQAIAVFYRVKPEDVQELRGSFRHAFDVHEQKGTDREKVSSWKDALVGTTSLPLPNMFASPVNRFDGRTIDQVVNAVYSELSSHRCVVQ